MNTLHDRGDAGVAATGLTGTWIIDHADSSISFAWRRLRFRTMTARRHCLGVIRLDDLPPVGAIGFRQPSGLPVLTVALDPASVDTGHVGLDAILGGADAFDVTRHRWWSAGPTCLRHRQAGLELGPRGSARPGRPCQPGGHRHPDCGAHDGPHAQPARPRSARRTRAPAVGGEEWQCSAPASSWPSPRSRPSACSPVRP
jgi:hypothetical protein